MNMDYLARHIPQKIRGGVCASDKYCISGHLPD